MTYISMHLKIKTPITNQSPHCINFLNVHLLSQLQLIPIRIITIIIYICMMFAPVGILFVCLAWKRSTSRLRVYTDTFITTNPDYKRPHHLYTPMTWSGLTCGRLSSDISPWTALSGISPPTASSGLYPRPEDYPLPSRRRKRARRGRRA